MSENESYETMAQFVRQISRFTDDNECPMCNRLGSDENPECPDHEPWTMPVDDALDTVRSLIWRARRLVTELSL